jgi:hypothetical protein
VGWRRQGHAQQSERHGTGGVGLVLTRGITRRHRHKGKVDAECRTVSVGDACFRNRLVVSAAKDTTNTRGRTAPVGGPPSIIQASVYTPGLSRPSVPVAASSLFLPITVCWAVRLHLSRRHLSQHVARRPLSCQF